VCRIRASWAPPNLEWVDLAVAADGDAVLVVGPMFDPLRAMRVAGEGGEARWNGEAEDRARLRGLCWRQTGRALPRLRDAIFPIVTVQFLRVARRRRHGPARLESGPPPAIPR